MEAFAEPAAVRIDPLAKARARGMGVRQRILAQEDMLTLAEAAQALGLTPPAVNDRFRAGKLLALEAGARGRRYPAWQFEDEIAGAPLEAVLRVLKGLNCWTIYRFFTTPDSALEDATPLEVLRRGDVEAAVEAARLFAQWRAGRALMASRSPPPPPADLDRIDLPLVDRKRGRVAASLPSRQATDPFSGCKEGAEGLPLRCAERGIRRHVLCLLPGSVLRRDAASHARLSIRPASEPTLVDESELRSQNVVRLGEGDGQRLVLADLTGGGLARLHCDGSISTVSRYDVPRQWALALWKHPGRVDGIRYVSRFMNSQPAVVLFDRCKDRLTAHRSQPLADHPDLPRILDLFNVGI